MHKICLLVFVAYFWIVINGQGGGGGGGGGSGGGGGGGGGGVGGGGGGGCKDESRDECIRNGYIFGGIFAGILMICIGCLIYHKFCKRQNGRPQQTNLTFVNSNYEQLENGVHQLVFQSGIWSARYYQYGRWHGPHELYLTFDHQSMKITGSGSDDVGEFIVDGVYSNITRRIGLMKKYQAGTGDRWENLSHHVIIQIMENGQTDSFEGKWYVRTNQYHGEDKFLLKRGRSSLKMCPGPSEDLWAPSNIFKI